MDENTAINANETDNETIEAVDTGIDNAENAESTDSDDSGTFVPDDALLERAVKAGMSLADAKSFGSKDMAERFIGMLEGKRNVGSGSEANDDGDEFSTIDFGELTEENGYEPNIVKAFNACKRTIEAQAKAIKKLSAGKTAEKQKKAVETRKNLILARPGGERGRISSGDDAEADILNSLRAKFKLN